MGDVGDAGSADAPPPPPAVSLLDLDDHLLVAVAAFLTHVELLTLQQARRSARARRGAAEHSAARFGAR